MKIGFVASCLDLGPHAGHVAMFKEAKLHCDYLILALHVNPQLERESKNVPVQSVSERYLTAKACRYVDEVIPYETESELVELLQLLRPDVRFLGEDYRDTNFTARDIGIPIHFCHRKHSVSSSGIRKKIKETYNE